MVIIDKLKINSNLFIKGENLNVVMDEILKNYEKWNLRISTGFLNDWLNRFKKVKLLKVIIFLLYNRLKNHQLLMGIHYELGLFLK
jgi:hypothetical protein